MDDHDDDYWYEKRNKGPRSIFDDDKTTTTTTSSSSSTRPKSVLDDIASSMPFKKSSFSTNKSTTKSDSSFPNVSTTGVSVRLKNESISFTNDPTSKEIKYKTEIANKNAQIITIMKNTEEPDIKETVERILNDKPFYFDLYKNKSQKIELLDEAISSYDGNAILAVILYLKRTLKPEIFRTILISRQTALNHYIYYLEQMKCFKELSEIYRQQGKLTDAALNEYRLINSNSKNNDDFDNYHEKIKILNEVKNNYANDISKVAQKQLQLIEFQNRLEIPKTTKSQNEIVTTITKSTTTLDDTLYDTIYYYIKNYRDLNRLHAEYSIDNVKRIFELNNKLYACVNVKALSENGAWTELDKFTKSQGLFSKRSIDITWETLIGIICAASMDANAAPNTPLAELIKYARLIENVETRNQIAVKYKIYDVAIETFVLLKDKNGLINYKNKLPQNSPESVKAMKAIQESNWK